MGEIINVGLGEIKLCQNLDDVLVAYGLGSCLGIGMYDPAVPVAGLLHAVLPFHPNGKIELNSRYVDTGIEALLSQMEKAGSVHKRLVIRMAGGANILNAPGLSPTFNIGTRNLDAAHEKFAQLNLNLSSFEVGGTIGRTIRFYANNGRMTIRTLCNQEREI
jgi:chemotaxis protein CheD